MFTYNFDICYKKIALKISAEFQKLFSLWCFMINFKLNKSIV